MRQSALEKWGRMVAGRRTRWITLIVWILAAAGLTLVFPSVNKQEINNAQNLADSAPSVQAEALIGKEFPNASGVPALLIWHRQGELTTEDASLAQSLAAKLTEHPLPQQTFVPPLQQMPVQALRQMMSKDQTTLVLPVFFAEQTETEILKDNLEQIQSTVRALAPADPFEASIRSDELSVRVSGPVGIQVDATELFKGADLSLLIATVLLVLVLLLLIYRSPILAMIPLIGVGFAYGVTGPILGWMASHGWITVDGQAISIMTVLLFGAGTDYCLFMISRYRQELTMNKDKLQALLHSITHVSGAVVMSGFTVVLSLITLLAAEYGAVHRFAVPFSLSILIMGLASLTLVPALLSIFGRASFYPFIPRTVEMEEERAKKTGKPARTHRTSGRIAQRIGGLVVQRPWTIVIVCAVALGGLTAVTPQIRFTSDLLSSFPESMPSREGFTVLSEAYSPGELAPVTVVADTEGKAISLQERLQALRPVGEVSEPATSKNNARLQSYELKLNINPYGTAAVDAIPLIRAAAEQSLAEAGISDAADKVWIGGQTAAQFDAIHTSKRDNRVIIPLVIGLIALLLLVYLRSITAMLYLIATVILSYGAALGLGWLIIHQWMGIDAIQGLIPLYAFVFLVALGEDYNIFMISSIWKKAKQMPLKQAIREGVSETGGVITSAGLILTGTFAVLSTLPIQVLLQFGIITALGILMDTFIVRPFLVPAITALFGKAAFWPGHRTNHEMPAAKRGS